MLFRSHTPGARPGNACPLHSPQAVVPPVGTLDQFGNPIALDTAGATSTEGLPDSTLTGGVFRTDTAPPLPPPEPVPVPPPTQTDTQPQPSTNTSEPQPSTNTSPPTQTQTQT